MNRTSKQLIYKINQASSVSKGEAPNAYADVLKELADYFLTVLPSDVDDHLVNESEYLLNTIYVQTNWKKSNQKIRQQLSESLAIASAMNHIVRSRSGDTRSIKYFEYVKRLSSSLYELIDSLE